MNLRPTMIPSGARPQGQRGTVLLMSLVILGVLLVSAVALVRSFDTTLFASGNLAFKRDLVHQGERVVPVVFRAFEDVDVLGTEDSRGQNLGVANYRTVVLNSNVQGVPLALLDDAAFLALSLDPANDIVIPEQGVTIRYVIDRMCLNEGEVTADHCRIAGTVETFGHSAQPIRRDVRGDARGSGGGVSAGLPVVYRISVRVTGPRNTRTFLQTTFAL